MLGILVLCFIGIDVLAAERALRVATIQAVHPGARVVFRRGDCFSGWVERSLNDKPVVAVDATGFPEVEAAFAAAEIPAVQFPEKEPALVPPVDPAPPEDPPADTDPAPSDPPADLGPDDPAKGKPAKGKK